MRHSHSPLAPGYFILERSAALPETDLLARRGEHRNLGTCMSPALTETAAWMDCTHIPGAHHGWELCCGVRAAGTGDAPPLPFPFQRALRSLPAPQTPGEPVAPAHYDNISNPSATRLISLPSQLPICKTMIATALSSQEAEKLSRNLNSP